MKADISLKLFLMIMLNDDAMVDKTTSRDKLKPSPNIGVGMLTMLI